MTKSQPRKTGKAKSTARQERLAKALRENLKRRKAQAKGRDEGGHGAADPAGGDS